MPRFLTLLARVNKKNLSTPRGRVAAKVSCVFIISLISTTLMAEPSPKQGSDWRCSWTDCGNTHTAQPKPTLSQLPPQIRTAPPLTTLKECTAQDREQCAEECRNHFDADFFKCLEPCMAKKCLSPKTPSEDLDQASACLEDESKSCKENCLSSSNDNQQNRCRLDCLQQRCPDAPSGLRAREANSPGHVKCTRCKTEHQRDCRDFCAISSAPLTSTGYAGLGALGCLKLCEQTSCAESCE